MSYTIRDIINEACVRINLTPRRQAPAGDIVENAFRLLKGIVAKYNNDNLLAWTQNSLILNNSELIHIYDESDVLKGEYNMYFDTLDEMNNYTLSEEDYNNDVWAIVKEQPNVYYTVTSDNTWQQHDANTSQRYQEMKRYETMQHVQIRDVAKIDSIYLVTNSNEPYKEHYKLSFVPHADFDRYVNTANVFTYTQKSEGEWLVQIKPNVAKMHYRLKLNYNEAIEFDINSDMFIPDNYIELLIVALAHKLALQYPRLDDAHMQRLENEVRVLVDNVRTPRASDRMLTRADYFVDGNFNLSQLELMGGYGII